MPGIHVRHLPLGPLINYLLVAFPHDDDDLYEEEDGTVRVSNKRAGDLLGITRTTVTIYRRDGIPEHVADRIATHLGRHPSEFWDEYNAPINLVMTVHANQRATAKKYLRQGRSIEHLEQGLVVRRRAG